MNGGFGLDRTNKEVRELPGRENGNIGRRADAEWEAVSKANVMSRFGSGACGEPLEEFRSAKIRVLTTCVAPRTLCVWEPGSAPRGCGLTGAVSLRPA
jgi:hypothetical protein